MASVVVAAGAAAPFPTKGTIASGRMVVGMGLLMAAMAGFLVVMFMGMGMFMLFLAGAAGTGFFQMFAGAFVAGFFHINQHSFPDVLPG